MTLRKDPDQNETKHVRKAADFAGRRVLEIGCGEGRLTWRYASDSRLTIGLDPDKDALRVAAIDRSPELGDRVHFTNAQAEQMPFNNEKFDIAILAWSL